MKKIRNVKRDLFFTAVTCMLVLFVGCATNNMPDTIVESSTVSAVSSTSLAATEDEQASEQNSMSLEEREAQFMQIANRDNYIVGEIIEVEFNPYPEECYLVVQCEDKQYRVSGSFGMMGEGLDPFIVADYDGGYGQGYSSLDSYSCKPGWTAYIFYADELDEGETSIIHPTLISFYYTPSMDSDWDINKEILKIQYSAQILKKNFSAIKDKKIYTPDEAMLRVADYMQIENPQKVELSQGRNMYTDGKVKIVYKTMFHNVYFSVDRAYMAELFQQDGFLDTSQYPYESTTATPFIHYLVYVYDAKGDESSENSIARYGVDIGGQILDSDLIRLMSEP